MNKPGSISLRIYLFACVAAILLSAVGCNSSKTGSSNPLSPAVSNASVQGKISGEGDMSGIPVYLLGTEVQVPPAANIRFSEASPASGGQLYFSITDSLGVFSFTDVVPGNYNLVAKKDKNIGGIKRNIAVSAGASILPTDLELLLTATGEISGQIQVPADFANRSGIIAFLPGTSYAAYTNENGAFIISGVPVGNYSVLFTAPGLARAKLDNITVSAGQAAILPLVVLAKDTSSVAGLLWKGTLAGHPVSPMINWAYYNSTDKKAYLWDGTTWQTLAESITGATGPQGPAGANGISITWKGTLTTAPVSPQLNWAYYNSTDKKSYIWDGSAWQILAMDGLVGPQGPAGADGVSIVWKGSLGVVPASPQMNWAYYNTTDKKSYIYNGSVWQILAQDGSIGPQGPVGTGIIWQGTHFISPATPQLNWAYYNSADGMSYIWDGSAWQILARDGGLPPLLPSAFITVWDTRNTTPDSSLANQIKLPLRSDGSYNFQVNWGDGTGNTIVAYNQAEVTHTYITSGEYKITIVGEITGWQFNNTGDREKILDIKQFGSLKLGNSGSYFYGCTNLKISASDPLDLTGTTSLYQAFQNCTSLSTAPSMANWDVSGVTSMTSMFSWAGNFNQDISAWNTANVSSIDRMFNSAFAFDQNIGGWNMGNVTSMNGVFIDAINFNQDIGAWDVSKVTDMYALFCGARSFNQDIGGWDVSHVTNMERTFAMASSFNQDIGNWDVSQVTNMTYIFSNATAFNQDISAWNVGNVTSIALAFQTAESFNQDISGWNTSSVTSIAGVFYGAVSFNQDINAWNVSNVTSMEYAFNNAESFNQDLSSWNVSNVTDMSVMFYNTALTTPNYDAILAAWSILPVQDNVNFGAGNTHYSASVAAARAMLVGKGWVITDGGQVP